MDHSPENLYAELLARKDERQRALPAIEVGGQGLSYAQLAGCVAETAQLLRAWGLQEEERVALQFPNSPEYIVAFLAVTAAGATVVPIDERIPGERLRFILEETTPALYLANSETAFPSDTRTTCGILAVEMTHGGVSLSPPLQPRRPIEEGGSAARTDGPAVILYSAGSTGQPKGAVLTQGQLLAIANTLSGVIGMNETHRDLIVVPMTHSGGWQRVTSTLLSGGCVVIFEGLLSVPALLDQLERYEISGFFTTPPLVRSLLRTPDKNVRGRAPCCHSIEIASAPVTPDELNQLMGRFPAAKVFYQYGLTECSRAVILDAKTQPSKRHTIGRPTKGVEVAILGSDGTLQDNESPGEILLRAPQLTKGYWKRDDLNRTRFRDGWFNTGDFGAIDSEGFVTYLGRRDDQINCGGLSYFPSEVEKELGTVDGIESYLIAGVPDPQGLMTDVPWAFVVPLAPKEWTAREFLRTARNRLPPHMVPRQVVVVPALSMTSTGKPNRRETVKRYGPGDGGDRR